MKFGLNSTIGGYPVKDVLGAVGLAGDLYAVATFLSGKVALIVGLLSLPLILVWGLSSRGPGERPFVRRLAGLAVAASAVALALAALAATLYLTGEPPDPLGAVEAKDSEDFELKPGPRPGLASGSYMPRFTREADIAEVGLTPVPEAARRVARIDVTNVSGAGEEIDSFAEMIDRRSETQIYYEVTRPSQNFTVTLDVRARLAEPAAAGPVRMRAHYRYARRDQMWRLRRWFFDNIAERLR